ncbi:MarR family winged helix-turn-helix transcriptional regulator [Helicobacter himalayensis]|uniref:MarR family winged helix-turn-helix transcriptional regulator n=1 Tax=Helicobacter himalayensis TaxID=1591088 RepID=UPI00082E191F|nr:MarR family transcriptional regulator [Helicobacter himalayensis]
MFEESILFTCAKLAHYMKYKSKEVVQMTGFSDGREIGLLMIVAEKQVSQIKIAEMVDTDKNTVRFFVDRLESLGLVKRQKNPNNRKENLIILTEQGKQKVDEILLMMLENERKLLYMYSDEEIKELSKLLAKFYKSMEESCGCK